MFAYINHVSNFELSISMLCVTWRLRMHACLNFNPKPKPKHACARVSLYSYQPLTSNMKKILAKSIVVLKVIGQLLFLYGLLGWIYGVGVQFIHPDWLPGGLSHLTPDLRLDIFTIISFIVSAVGFFIWRLTKELIDSTLKSRTLKS